VRTAFFVYLTASHNPLYSVYRFIPIIILKSLQTVRSSISHKSISFRADLLLSFYILFYSLFRRMWDVCETYLERMWDVCETYVERI